MVILGPNNAIEIEHYTVKHDSVKAVLSSQRYFDLSENVFAA